MRYFQKVNVCVFVLVPRGATHVLGNCQKSELQIQEGLLKHRLKKFAFMDTTACFTFKDTTLYLIYSLKKCMLVPLE